MSNEPFLAERIKKLEMQVSQLTASEKPVPERWQEQYDEVGPDGDGAEKHLRACIEELGAAEALVRALEDSRAQAEAKTRRNNGK